MHLGYKSQRALVHVLNPFLNIAPKTLYGALSNIQGKMMKKLISGLLVLSALAIQTPVVHAQPTESGNAQANEGTSQQQRIDLNSATVEQLITLPGVGQSKAKAIIKYREEVGPFLEVAQLTQVKGIGEKMLNKIESYVQVR